MFQIFVDQSEGKPVIVRLRMFWGDQVTMQMSGNFEGFPLE